MIGPKVSVMERLGAKKDSAIFGEGEAWRILACNWLHAGVVHLAFNLGAIWQVGRSVSNARRPRMHPTPYAQSLSRRGLLARASDRR